MFDSLSGKLQNAFSNLRGLGKISEANVGDALREVRMALARSRREFQGRPRFHRARQSQVPRRRKSFKASSPASRSSKSSTTNWWTCSARRTPALNLSGNPSLHPDGRPARLGQNHFQRQARPAAAQAGPHAVARRGGRLSPGGHGPARNARQTARHCRCSSSAAKPMC